MTTKSSWPALNPPTPGRLSNTPTTVKRSAPTRTSFPIGSVPVVANSAWYGGLTEHHDVAAVLHFGAGEEPARHEIELGSFGEVLGRAEHNQQLGAEIAIEHAVLGGRSTANAKLDVDQLNRRTPALRWRVRRTPSGWGA